jgi:hypothetical protein
LKGRGEVVVFTYDTVSFVHVTPYRSFKILVAKLYTFAAVNMRRMSDVNSGTDFHSCSGIRSRDADWCGCIICLSAAPDLPRGRQCGFVVQLHAHVT